MFVRDKERKGENRCFFCRKGVALMEQSPSYKKTIQYQFQAYCYKVLRGEVVDYYRYVDYLQKHEKSFEDLSDEESDELYVSDKYEAENHLFKVLEYDISVKSDLLAEVLHLLSQKKRDVILLSFFLGMSDTEIARVMCVVNSTIHEHKKKALKLLKSELKKRGMEE